MPMAMRIPALRCKHISDYSIALYRVALRCVALRCVALRCVALRCVALRCVALRCVALRYNYYIITCLYNNIIMYAYSLVVRGYFAHDWRFPRPPDHVTAKRWRHTLQVVCHCMSVIRWVYVDNPYTHSVARVVCTAPSTALQVVWLIPVVCPWQ